MTPVQTESAVPQPAAPAMLAEEGRHETGPARRHAASAPAGPVAREPDFDPRRYLSRCRLTFEQVYAGVPVEPVGVIAGDHEEGWPALAAEARWGADPEPSEWYVVFDWLDFPVEYQLGQAPPAARRQPVDFDFAPPPGARRVAIHELQPGRPRVVRIEEQPIRHAS